MRLTLLSTLCLAAATVPAQTYKTTILVKGLNKPIGIAVHSSGDLYFTEIPSPGKFGSNNTVSLWIARTGKTSVIVKGEPAPTHIVVLPNRDFYWTCNSAGVIMRGKGTSHSSIGTGLSNPNGIAVTGKGRVFFTQLPTPGKSGKQGGKNNVAELVNGKATVLKSGEPEPVDIVVDANDNLYWTCKSAGVILRRDAKTGKVSLVLDKLEKPSGIAMDAAGNLYFTEVPTPGKFANQGGRNKVWKYDPKTKNLTLIHFGIPEPTDVTVTSDGKQVYWTCTTVGVIMRADRTGSAPTVTSKSTTRVGDKVNLTLSAPGQAGKVYVAASSLGAGPIPVDKRFLALTPDILFWATVLNLAPPIFTGYIGKLDSRGGAMARINIPNDANLQGLNILTAFVVLDTKSPTGVAQISSSFRFKIE